MSDTNQDPSQSGAEGVESTDNETGGQKSETVTREAYERLLDEKKQAASRLRDLESQLGDIQAKQREADEAKAKENGEWQKIAADKEAEAQRLKDALSQKDGQLRSTLKLSAAERALPGVPENYLKAFLDLDSIEVGDDFKVSQDSVKAAVDKFKVEHPSLLPQTKQTPPDDAGSKAGSRKLAYSEWVKLPHKEKKARMNEIDQSTM